MRFRASGFFGFAGSFVALAILSATELIPFALALQQTSEVGLPSPALRLREKQPDAGVDNEAAAETDAQSDDEPVGRDLGPGLMIEAALEPIDSPPVEVQIDEPTTDAETTVEEEPGGLRVIDKIEQVEDVGEEQVLGEIPELTVPAVRAEAAKFNGIQPGTSVSADVVIAWGKPDKTIDVADGAVLVYMMKPFDRIEVTLVDDVVASILIYLGRPFDLVGLTERLKLDHIAAVDVVDDDGVALGRSFPELGVLFSFVPGGRSRQVAQIFMESIDAEPFVLRVKSNLRGRYSLNLRDLEFAIGLDPDRAESHWLAAQMLLAVGEVSRAEKAAARAVKLDDKTEYRLTWAESLACQGKHDQAVRETLAALEAQNLSPVVKARGLVLLGDLVAADDTHDYGAALDLHIEAIEIAEPLAREKQVAVRRVAKEILIDANLSVAYDIGVGRWRQKKTVVPKWVDRASAFAEEMIDNEHGSLEFRLFTAQRSLRALSGFKESIDPGELIDEARRTADDLVRGSSDPLWSERIYWELGVAYYHTLQIYHDRGDVEQSLKFGTLAEKYMRLGGENREITPDADQLVGRLYYQIGTIHAVLSKDHGEAVVWYEKAVQRLTTPVSNSSVSSLQQQGEAVVSMGVSFWETGELDEAVEMTEEGVQIIEKAVVTGGLDRSILTTSYGNLSAMYRELGDTEKAQYFADLAAESRVGSPREARRPAAARTSNLHGE